MPTHFAMRFALIMCCLLLETVLSGRDWCDSDWQQEFQQDTDAHDCRSCKATEIDNEANCPSEGFVCDTEQPISASMLTAVHSCGCQTLQCAARGWRLAVNGTIVDKIHCRSRQWTTADVSYVPSAVCSHVKDCTVCKQNLITISPTTEGGGWDVDIVEGKCAQLTATCSGATGVVAKVNGESIAPETKVVAVCSEDGSAWLYQGQPVTTLDCAVPGRLSGQGSSNRCLKCPSLASVSITAAQSYMVTDGGYDTTSGCVVQHFTCFTGTGDVIVDFGGGLTTGVVPTPNNFDLTCSADGTAWQYMGTPVTTGVCKGPTPCPSVPQAGSVDGYITTPLKSRPPEDGAEVYSCDAPEVMLYVVGGTTMELPITAKILCKPNSGIFVNENGVTVGTELFTCGSKQATCQSCDPPKLLDKTDPSCDQAELLCTAKPINTPDTSGCPRLSCAADGLYLVTSAEASEEINPEFVKCEEGVWKYGASEDPIPEGAIGFVCGKPATCDPGCKDAVENAFLSDPSLLLPPSQTKPSCTYTCLTPHILIANGAVHQSVVCSMETGALTLDSADGALYDPTNNKFDCVMCGCTASQVSDGAAGLCDAATQICVAPTVKSECEATCPDGSTAIYVDNLGEKQTTAGTAIVCDGGQWIAAGSTDVTCAYSKSGQLPTTAPDVPKPCTPKDLPPLTTAPCTNPADCDHTKLIYLPYNGGYYAMCSKGNLVTDGLDTGAVVCDPNGVWPSGVSGASCLLTAEPASECILAMASLGGAASVNVDCAFRQCTLTCAAGNQQFRYMLDDGSDTEEQYTTIACLGSKPVAADLKTPIVATSVTCI